MKRQIVDRKRIYINKKGGWRVYLTLECGHVVRVKGSKEPKRETNCSECHFAEYLKKELEDG